MVSNANDTLAERGVQFSREQIGGKVAGGIWAVELVILLLCIVLKIQAFYNNEKSFHIDFQSLSKY